MLNRTPEVDSSDSKNPNVLIQMAGRNINTNNALSIGSHFPIVFFVRYLYSSILFDFKAFTKGSVFPLAMFKDVVQIFRLRILKRKANVNNDDNDNVSECDDNDKKAKKVITSRKWI